MGAPIGNKNNPVGRPTAAQEFANFKLLWDILTEESDLPALQAKVDSGKFSPMDRIRLMVLQGDKDWLQKLFIRFFPEVQVIDARSDNALINPEQIHSLASVIKRFAVELHNPSDIQPVSPDSGGAVTPALRPDVPAPLPDQSGPSVPPGDSPAPEGPAPTGDRTA